MRSDSCNFRWAGRGPVPRGNAATVTNPATDQRGDLVDRRRRGAPTDSQTARWLRTQLSASMSGSALGGDEKYTADGGARRWRGLSTVAPDVRRRDCDGVPRRPYPLLGAELGVWYRRLPMPSRFFLPATVVSLTTALFVAPALAPTKPNVVVILADDQGWGDLSVHGNTNLSTPNINSRMGRSR